MGVEVFRRLADRQSAKIISRGGLSLVALALAVTASILTAGQVQAQEETIRQVSVLKILSNLKRYPRLSLTQVRNYVEVCGWDPATTSNRPNASAPCTAQKRAILQMESFDRIQFGSVIEAGYQEFVAARQQVANAERAKAREAEEEKQREAARVGEAERSRQAEMAKLEAARQEADRKIKLAEQERQQQAADDELQERLAKEGLVSLRAYEQRLAEQTRTRLANGSLVGARGDSLACNRSDAENLVVSIIEREMNSLDLGASELRLFAENRKSSKSRDEGRDVLQCQMLLDIRGMYSQEYSVDLSNGLQLIVDHLLSRSGPEILVRIDGASYERSRLTVQRLLLEALGRKLMQKAQQEAQGRSR